MDKIGNVSIRKITKNTPDNEGYSDGPSEKELLSIVSSPDYSKRRKEIVDQRSPWPLYYHLSPVRGNLINWYDFKDSSRILEVGAGCGAITESILQTIDNKSSVDALELSLLRAKINGHRNKDATNLNILVGNLENLPVSSGYDYIVCVGVLEYAGRFISADDPFKHFANKLLDLLRPGGTLLLAIENKLGLKYINGAREDHIGSFHESIMSYPTYSGVKTFSKKELSDLFYSSGKVKNISFHLPVPDYKLPRIVVTADTAEGTNIDLAHILNGAYPAPALDQQRYEVMSEQLLFQSFVRAGLFSETANSFLIEVKKQ